MATKKECIRSINVKICISFFLLIFFIQSNLISQIRNENCDSLIQSSGLEFTIKSISGATEYIGSTKPRYLSCSEVIMLIDRRKEDEDVVLKLDRFTEVLILKKHP